MEQVKGPVETRQKIIAAAKEARKSKDYPAELQNPDCHFILDKYGDPPNRPVASPYPNLDRKQLLSLLY